MRCRGYFLIEVLAAISVFSITLLCVFISTFNILKRQSDDKRYLKDLYTASNICEYFKSEDYSYLSSKIYGSDVSLYVYFDNADEFINKFKNYTLINGHVNENYNECCCDMESDAKKYGAYVNFNCESEMQCKFYKLTLSLWNMKVGEKSKVRLESYAGR